MEKLVENKIKKILRIVCLSFAITAIFVFIGFLVTRYSTNDEKFMLGEEISLAVSLTFSLTLNFNIFHIENSFNSVQILKDDNISKRDLELAEKLEKMFQNLNFQINEEKQIKSATYYCIVYDVVRPIRENLEFKKSQFVFHNVKLQQHFDEILDAMDKIIDLRGHYGSYIMGEMKKTYESLREILFVEISKFYIVLSDRSDEEI